MPDQPRLLSPGEQRSQQRSEEARGYASNVVVPALTSVPFSLVASRSSPRDTRVCRQVESVGWMRTVAARRGSASTSIGTQAAMAERARSSHDLARGLTGELPAFESVQRTNDLMQVGSRARLPKVPRSSDIGMRSTCSSGPKGLSLSHSSEELRVASAATQRIPSETSGVGTLHFPSISKHASETTCVDHFSFQDGPSVASGPTSTPMPHRRLQHRRSMTLVHGTALRAKTNSAERRVMVTREMEDDGDKAFPSANLAPCQSSACPRHCHSLLPSLPHSRPASPQQKPDVSKAVAASVAGHSRRRPSSNQILRSRPYNEVNGKEGQRRDDSSSSSSSSDCEDDASGVSTRTVVLKASAAHCTLTSVPIYIDVRKGRAYLQHITFSTLGGLTKETDVLDAAFLSGRDRVTLDDCLASEVRTWESATIGRQLQPRRYTQAFRSHFQKKSHQAVFALFAGSHDLYNKARRKSYEVTSSAAAIDVGAHYAHFLGQHYMDFLTAHLAEVNSDSHSALPSQQVDFSQELSRVTHKIIQSMLSEIWHLLEPACRTYMDGAGCTFQIGLISNGCLYLHSSCFVTNVSSAPLRSRVPDIHRDAFYAGVYGGVESSSVAATCDRLGECQPPVCPTLSTSTSGLTYSLVRTSTTRHELQVEDQYVVLSTAPISKADVPLASASEDFHLTHSPLTPLFEHRSHVTAFLRACRTPRAAIARLVSLRSGHADGGISDICPEQKQTTPLLCEGSISLLLTVIYLEGSAR